MDKLLLQQQRVSYLTSNSSNFSFSINADNVSPTWMGPTPFGVPVKIKSPARSVKNFERYEITYSKLNIIRLVLPCCRIPPLIAKLKFISFKFLNSATGINFSEMGAEPLK